MSTPSQGNPSEPFVRVDVPTARKMIEMVASIDAEHFKNHPAVRCFTCHEGHEHPLTHPLFPDEAAAAKAAQPPQR